MSMLGLIESKWKMTKAPRRNQRRDEKIRTSLSLSSSPTKSRAVRRFIPMMWIDQVESFRLSSSADFLFD